MEYVIAPSRLQGDVTPPPSKSASQRVLALALLHRGTTIVRGFGQSDDEAAALGLIRQLGAQTSLADDELTIVSKGEIGPITSLLHAGESGLAARLFTPIAATHPSEITVAGSGTLVRRPMQGLATALRAAGKVVTLAGDTLPITMSGHMHLNNLALDGSESSQTISGMMMAASAVTRTSVDISISNPVSVPYLELTSSLMHKFGREVTHHPDWTHVTVHPRATTLPDPVTIEIEKDWSGAAPWLVAAALGCDVVLSGLKRDSVQADRMLLKVLQSCGCKVTWIDGTVRVTRSGTLKPFITSLDSAPDLGPLLAVLAGAADGASQISGLDRLTGKESNRRTGMIQLLNALGVSHDEQDDTLFIQGTKSFSGGTIDGQHDHRMVMAAAIASVRADNHISITDCESVHKSYPQFWQHATSLGMQYQAKI